MYFYLSCWRFFGLLKPVNWWISLVVFEDCLYPVLSPLFGCHLGSDQLQAFLLSSMSQLPLQILHLFIALGHILENFISYIFQLTHSLFRWSNLLACSLNFHAQGLSFLFLEVLLSCFSDLPGLFIVSCFLHMILVCLLFL